MKGWIAQLRQPHDQRLHMTAHRNAGMPCTTQHHTSNASRTHNQTTQIGAQVSYQHAVVRHVEQHDWLHAIILCRLLHRRHVHHPVGIAAGDKDRWGVRRGWRQWDLFHQLPQVYDAHRAVAGRKRLCVADRQIPPTTSAVTRERIIHRSNLRVEQSPCTCSTRPLAPCQAQSQATTLQLIQR
jgi:hypothetical protein